MRQGQPLAAGPHRVCLLCCGLLGTKPKLPAPMTDDPVVRVLEEIRDLKRQNVDNYQEALRNRGPFPLPEMSCGR
jgi:hypothetical protein